MDFTLNIIKRHLKIFDKMNFRHILSAEKYSKCMSDPGQKHVYVTIPKLFFKTELANKKNLTASPPLYCTLEINIGKMMTAKDTLS